MLIVCQKLSTYAHKSVTLRLKRDICGDVLQFSFLSQADLEAIEIENKPRTTVDKGRMKSKALKAPE